MKGRSIIGNIRKSAEIITHFNRSNKAGIILQIDFEKCFDRVEFNAIEGSLHVLGFGEHFIKMLMLLYHKMEMCTTNNGHCSMFFEKTRGTNQGCPASPLVYTFCGEIMARLIYANPDIRGLNVHGIENILCQFADDTSVYLEYSAICVNAFLQTMSQVEAAIGLKISYEKTMVYRIGSIRNTNAKLYTIKPLTWSDGPMETLGIQLPCDGSDVCENNYQEILIKLRKVCTNWYNRSLNLSSKVLIVNTLMGSLFVYRMSTVLSLSKIQLNELEKIIKDFVWSGKKPKIAFVTLCKKREQGGLRLVNLQAKQDSIMIGNIFRLSNDPFLSKCMSKVLSPALGEMIWRCNLNPKTVQANYDMTDFWVKMLYAWSKINYHIPTCKEEILNQMIWLNSCMLIGNKPVEWRNWISQGIFYIKDLMKGEELNEFKTAEELGVNWLKHKQIMATMSKDWKNLLENGAQCSDYQLDLYTKLCVNVGTRNRLIYDMLINDNLAVLKYYNRWVDNVNLLWGFDEYVAEFNRLYAYTQRTKFRDFQYRLLLGKLVTNKDLFEWKLKLDSSCTFCKETEETTFHLLYDCPRVKPIVDFLLNVVCSDLECTVYTDKWHYLFSHIVDSAKHVANFLCTVTKQFIYKTRCAGNAISLVKFKRELEYLYIIEGEIAKSEFRTNVHTRRWSPIKLFQ